MILAHYTDAPLEFDSERTYEQDRPTFKPRGFWLTVDGPDGWKAWCERESFRLSSLQHRTEFRIRDDANVLRLSSMSEVLAFTETYPDDRFRGWVDWTPVVARYDGVLISPYLWDAHIGFGTNWYSCWDVASACVWNLNAIELAGVAVLS